MSSLRRALVAAEPVFLVALGAFAGANGRHLVGLFVESSLLSTALVNVVGSVALGALAHEAELLDALSGRSRRVLGTGFLSSFTTYSTFVLDALTAAPAVGLFYVVGSYALGFTGVLLGREAVSSLSTGDAVGSDA